MTLIAEPPARVFQGVLSDSTLWSGFRPRPGDIVVSTPPKSGTTWVQAIVALLLSGDPEGVAQVSATAPWVDYRRSDPARMLARLDAQSGRRQVKTHSPLDAVPFWPDLRYICVYRHPLDVHLSYCSHAANVRRGPVKPLYDGDPAEVFARFLTANHADGASLTSILWHYRATLAKAQRDNLLVLHYADMVADLPFAVRRIADHIGVRHPAGVMAALTGAAGFAAMKAKAAGFAPAAGTGHFRSDAGFFAAGPERTWVGHLPDAAVAAYADRMDAALGHVRRRWVEVGDTAPCEGGTGL